MIRRPISAAEFAALAGIELDPRAAEIREPSRWRLYLARGNTTMLWIIALLLAVIGLSLSLPRAPRKSANERESITTEGKIIGLILVGVAALIALANLLT